MAHVQTGTTQYSPVGSSPDVWDGVESWPHDAFRTGSYAPTDNKREYGNAHKHGVVPGENGMNSATVATML
jgi:hypothetical protein